MSLHPVHLTPDKEGNLPPSALIPFCSYQGESSLLGTELPEMDNMTICDKFQPTVHEGQLCYSIDIAKFKVYPSKSGKSFGLFLLLDPKPYDLKQRDESVGNSIMEDQHFKVYIHTLAQYTTYGPGSSVMSTLKKMTGTTNFKKLPDHQRKCLDHDREKCQTQNYLQQVLNKCKCVPWALQTEQVKSRCEIKNAYTYFAGCFRLWPREGDLCCRPNSER